MRLSDRLQRQHGASSPMMPTRRDERVSHADDPLAKVKQNVQAALFARLGSRLHDASLTEDRLLAFVQQELSAVVAQQEGLV